MLVLRLSRENGPKAFVVPLFDDQVGQCVCIYTGHLFIKRHNMRTLNLPESKRLILCSMKNLPFILSKKS